jgi:LacI family transcriptional regulator
LVGALRATAGRFCRARRFCSFGASSGARARLARPGRRGRTRGWRWRFPGRLRPARKIGYEAGAEIDRQISSSFSNKPVIRLDPIGVNARQSTDTIFARDEVVVKALRYIRSHAAGSPYISDIARFVGVARTTLQTRFHAVVGHTMLDEIQRVRIQLAKELLRTSDLSLEMISDRCGFGNSQRFSVLFRQRTGMAPSQFRRASR